jgi:hypothetical protein
MPFENGVADFIVNDNNVWILEINPFQDYEGASIRGSLFNWK